MVRQPVKLACLACRSQRVRCDGLETCARCLRTGKECVYIQSRRGRRQPKSFTADPIALLDTNSVAPANAAAFNHSPMQSGLGGDLDPDLFVDHDDGVFDSIFFNPSYPFTPSLGLMLDGQDLQNLGILRQYQCDHDILDAYYVWIHPTFPALPDPQYAPVDRPIEWIPLTVDELPSYCPSNPLILAILAIVVMIPIPDNVETNTPAMRRQFSRTIAARAYEGIMNGAPPASQSSSIVHNPAHPMVPPEVESILALCLLGQFEYLQNGNMEKMQHLTKEALDGAMRLELHLYVPGKQSVFDDARRRTWWTVYLCACNVTIVACVPPIMPLKDPESIYTTPYPQSGNWRIHVKAERVLVLATLFLMNLIREFGNPAEMDLIRKSMQTIDGELCRSLGELDSLDDPFASSFHMKVALIRLHSARIKVHRYCALLDDDNASLDPVLPDLSTGTPNPPTQNNDSGRHFPFSSIDSMQYCLESAHVISRTLPGLATIQIPGTDSRFYTFTPFACPIVLAGYTFLMLRGKAETLISSAEPGPADRGIQNQCERGAASCMEVLDGFSQAWIHLSDAAMHMKEAAKCL